MSVERNYHSFEESAHEQSVGVRGFDMRPTLAWYSANQELLGTMLADRLSTASSATLPPITDEAYIEMGDTSLSTVVGLVPSSAQERSILTAIQGSPPLWFHQDSTAATPLPTTDRSLALSETAIIPGHTGYSRAEGGELQATITLFSLPQDGVPDEGVRGLITTEAAIHEYLHTVITSPLYNASMYLRLPNGEIVNGKQFLMEVYLPLAQDHPPISHYASVYRDAQNHFTEEGDQKDRRLAVNEDLSETITAHLLGFASGSLTDITQGALHDRPEVAAFVDDFLQAELVAGEPTALAEVTRDPQELVEEYRNLAA